MLQRELEFARKTFDSGAKLAFSKRGQLVKEGLDHGRVKNNHDELEADPVQVTFDIRRQKDRISDAYMNPINHGTKRSPAHWKMYRNTARKGEPSTKAKAHPLRRSVTKMRGVVLLKPCFSSKTKVP